jgi:hypothetical protein
MILKTVYQQIVIVVDRDELAKMLLAQPGFEIEKIEDKQSEVHFIGTTPVNRGEPFDGLKKSGSFGHPVGRDLLGSAGSRLEEACDEPADPILP